MQVYETWQWVVVRMEIASGKTSVFCLHRVFRNFGPSFLMRVWVLEASGALFSGRSRRDVSKSVVKTRFRAVSTHFVSKTDFMEIHVIKNPVCRIYIYMAVSREGWKLTWRVYNFYIPIYIYIPIYFLYIYIFPIYIFLYIPINTYTKCNFCKRGPGPGPGPACKNCILCMFL